ncbi:DoxX family membrane protein [Microbacterium kribbense]|uniref:DoxX family membrane protein n=1 Tax=Microbacterium kribbense TaxID=433645 RepID=A0ABP7G163_9MICO
MATATLPSADAETFWGRVKADPAFGAFWILRVGFIILPLLMGLDKFFNVMVDWTSYLAPWIANLSPLGAQNTMYVVGVIEIIAAIGIAVKPRWASWVVAAWLVGIIINLVTGGTGTLDIALRDLGLVVAALALAALAAKYNRGRA